MLVGVQDRYILIDAGLMFPEYVLAIKLQEFLFKHDTFIIDI